MTTTGVKFIIDAEDRASAKIRKTTEDVERQVKSVKDVGGQSKASAELIGTLAGALGNSGIGSFTSEIAEVTDRVSAFGDVAQQGGAGALAFKAGLVAAVGTLSFKFGQAIGDAIFETKRFRRELERTAEVSRELDNAFSQRLSERIQDEKERIGLIIDPDEQAKAFEELETQIQTELSGASTQIKRLQKQVDEFNDSWDFTDVGAQQNRLNEQGIEAAKERRRILQDQLLQLQRQNGEHAKNLESMKQANEAQGLIERLEKEASLAGKTAREREKASEQVLALEGEQLSTALQLIDKKHDILQAEKDRIKAEKEIADKQKQERMEAERIAKLKESTLQSIKLQTIELTQGKEAAMAMALEFKGIESGRASAFASLQSRLQEISRLGSGSRTQTSALVGSDNRFGSGRAERNAQLRDRQEQVRLAKRRDDLLAQVVAELKVFNSQDGPNVTIPVVGR